MNQIYYDQWIQSLPDFSARSGRRLLEIFPGPEEFLEASKERLEEILPAGQCKILWEARQKIKSLEDMKNVYERLWEKGIGFVSFRQAEYPEHLLEIPDAPIGLYYKGKLPTNEGLSVAIIGSRECTEYGRHVAVELGDYLGKRGISVISGMARGIDGFSQQAALNAGGTSFGVLGCGVDICYPSSNRGLYESLIEKGGILSTYAPGTEPLPRYFPPRNRIVSGLADALVVVEARVKSGTLITVDMALEQGREVYVVPGRVTDRLSDGCNRLIKQGAGIYLNPESFLEELEELAFLKRITPGNTEESKKRMRCMDWSEDEANEKPKSTKENGINQKIFAMSEETASLSIQEYGRTKREDISKISGIEEELLPVWNCLDFTPKVVGDICEELENQYSVAELGTLLMRLTLKGVVKQVSPGHFCKNG